MKICRLNRRLWALFVLGCAACSSGDVTDGVGPPGDNTTDSADADADAADVTDSETTTGDFGTSGETGADTTGESGETTGSDGPAGDSTTGDETGDGDSDDDSPWYAGVNLAGAEFGEQELPGVYGTHYIYPNAAEIEYFVAKGMNVFRLPFRWERLQLQRGGELDPAELGRIDEFVAAAKSAGATVILDPHNYARYDGQLVGSTEVPISDYADFWSRLASEYANDEAVLFGLMNEPHDMSTEVWVDAANAAIAAIRSVGAQNVIFVPGNGWTGAWTWFQDWYGTPNAQAMLNIVDSGDNVVFEVHQYFDAEGSGVSEACTSPTVGQERLTEFTAWLRQHELRGFLGEFSGGRNDTCYQALDSALTYLEANDDVWIGWSYWAAGPWWGEYMFTLEPTPQGEDRPQMDVLEGHLP